MSACGGGDDDSTVTTGDNAKAVVEAQHALKAAQNSHADLSAGPCLSESLPGLDDWVADIAHDPRQGVDDDPANQCQRFRSGEAHHFVELTPEGQLIRAE